MTSVQLSKLMGYANHWTLQILRQAHHKSGELCTQLESIRGWAGGLGREEPLRLISTSMSFMQCPLTVTKPGSYVKSVRPQDRVSYTTSVHNKSKNRHQISKLTVCHGPAKCSVCCITLNSHQSLCGPSWSSLTDEETKSQAG